MTPPIKGYKHATYPAGNVTQFFALNPQLYSKAVCFPDQSLPEKKYCLRGHNGLDIVAPWGTPIFAVESGDVIDVNDSPSGYGKHVRTFRDGVEWTYGHCSEILVKQGDFVSEGQMIARIGNTGFVVSGATPYWKFNPYAGTHLHLGKRVWKRVDIGWTFIHKEQRYALTDYYNGYFGYVDFSYDLALATGAVDTPQQSALRLTLRSLYNQLMAAIKASRG